MRVKRVRAAAGEIAVHIHRQAEHALDLIGKGADGGDELVDPVHGRGDALGQELADGRPVQVAAGVLVEVRPQIVSLKDQTGESARHGSRGQEVFKLGQRHQARNAVPGDSRDETTTARPDGAKERRGAYEFHSSSIRHGGDHPKEAPEHGEIWRKTYIF